MVALRFTENDAVEAQWHDTWYPATFVRYGHSDLGVRWEEERDVHWRPEGWVRWPAPAGGERRGFGGCREVRTTGDACGRCSWWSLLPFGSCLAVAVAHDRPARLLNRAPEHCLHVIQEPELVEGLRALLRGPCPALAADAAAALLRTLEGQALPAEVAELVVGLRGAALHALAEA